MMESLSIGIDLGTTYSCVGIHRDGRTEIICNDQGNRVTPSYVAFNDTERLIGDAAKNQASRNAENTVFDAKRLIGRVYSDPVVQQDIALWPFRVEEFANGKPLIVVRHKGIEAKFTAEEISSMILLKMKQTAEDFLGRPVTSAVVTVPAYFNDSQRQATKDAGTIAGLEVRRIINEPTAAAIAYGLDKDRSVEETILVFDLGGGTFDVSLLSLQDDILEVRATSGDTHLGGVDFDNRLVEHCIEEIKRKYQTDIRRNPRAVRKLRTACERAKRALSSSVNATIELDAIGEEEYYIPLSRVKFDDLNIDYFHRCIEIVDTLLQDNGITVDEVDQVVLIGGSTRIVKVKEMLQAFFKGKDLNRSINPDEAVAIGASVQAAILSSSHNEQVSLLLLDVTPLSLGLKLKGGLMDILVPRNTLLPAKRSAIYTTVEDQQTSILFSLYEGERSITAANNLLGEFRLTEITPGPASAARIEVTIDIDTNGIVCVSAINTSTGFSNQIVITNSQGRLSSEEISRMIESAEKFKEDDLRFKLNAAARNKWERSLFKLKGFLSKHAEGTILEADRTLLVQAHRNSQEWFEQRSEAQAAELQWKRDELRRLIKPIMSRYAEVS
jgi:L1 cell adhesion molecule like protein